jgi:hypothetical protein
MDLQRRPYRERTSRHQGSAGRRQEGR